MSGLFDSAVVAQICQKSKILAIANITQKYSSILTEQRL
jgi:hypothetical protein